MSAFDIPIFKEITEIVKPDEHVRGKRGVASPRPERPRKAEVIPLDHPDRVPPMSSNWKTAKPYQYNTAMRDALERARGVQPALVSIFNKPEGTK
jgi:hypothetical protein